MQDKRFFFHLHVKTLKYQTPPPENLKGVAGEGASKRAETIIIIFSLFAFALQISLFWLALFFFLSGDNKIRTYNRKRKKDEQNHRPQYRFCCGVI